MNGRKWITGALVGATMLFTTSVAEAAPFLSKSQARAKAKTTVRHMYNDMDYALDWYVGSCHRLRRNKIDCDYTITQEASDGGADIDCDDTVRITKRSYGILWIDFPYEPDCY